MESTKNSLDVNLELKKAWMDKRTSIYLKIGEKLETTSMKGV